MSADKTAQLYRLRKDILPLEGLRALPSGSDLDLGLSFMKEAFPQGSFPLGAVHEFIADNKEGSAASSGFVASLFSDLIKKGSIGVWIGSSKNIFPPALKMFGIEPDRILFIELKKEKDILWAMEEALKCENLAGVVCELSELSFSVSRRFQLAVEKSRVTGFVLRNPSSSLVTNACVSRWRISPISTVLADNLPGLGFPRWKVELLKIRNGKPGTWQIEWSADKLHLINDLIPDLNIQFKRKTG